MRDRDLRKEFLDSLKKHGLIVDYKMEHPGHASVHIYKPLTQLRIDVYQKKCECGCCDTPDYGPCDDYERGANTRCVYCDHSEECHKAAHTPKASE